MSTRTFLGSVLPLIQAPMAGVQDARLAAAAARAGALGSLPAAMLAPDALDRELAALHATGLPHNVNFFAHVPPAADPAREARWRARLAPLAAELGVDLAQAPAGAGRLPFGAAAAEVLERWRPPVVSFHFGLPEAALLARVKALGTLVLASATTLDEALWLQAHGADAVIAQGLEAGGHRGHFLSTDTTRQCGTLELLARLRPHLRVPLVAAGGLAEAADVRAALARGADAVQAGTAFLLCDEATTGPLHRARLADLQAPTALTNLFTGGLARGLHNRLMRELGPVSDDAPPFPLVTAAIAPLRSAAEAAGRDDCTPLWSGTNRRGCRAAPAAAVVQALAAGFAVA
jgi:nitronate monooxygenase